MKKQVVFLAVLSVALFAACDKKGNSYDFAQILYPGGYGSVVYADQPRDTLRFATTYDWTLSCPDDWVHISSDSMAGTVPDGYYMVNKVWVNFDANTTDSLRSAIVFFNADGKSLMTLYNQLHYLNVMRPSRQQDRFLLTDTATQLCDSLMFTTYASGWTLSFKGEQPAWMRLAEDAVTTGRAGTYKVFYELDANEDTVERSTVLELKSRGVVTEIEVRQLKASGSNLKKKKTIN